MKKTRLSPRPGIKLSKLRDIAWDHWDPIGLLAEGGYHTGQWTDEANQRIADEYDHYMKTAAVLLRDGATAAQVVDYLVQIEAEHMGLGVAPTTLARAEAVVAAISDDETIWTWPDENGQFS